MSIIIPNIPDNCYYDGTAIPTSTLQSMSPEPEPEPQITLQEKTITNTENGQSIVTPDTGYNGLSQVTINTNVPAHTSVLQSKSETISTNTTTTISPDQGYDGLSSVSITTQVPQPVLKANQNFTALQNNTTYEITPDTGYDAMQKVTVNTNIQTNLQSKSQTITSNTTTTITPDNGYDGLSSVSITTQVPTTQSSIQISSIAIELVKDLQTPVSFEIPFSDFTAGTNPDLTDKCSIWINTDFNAYSFNVQTSEHQWSQSSACYYHFDDQYSDWSISNVNLKHNNNTIIAALPYRESTSMHTGIYHVVVFANQNTFTLNNLPQQ